MEEQTHNIEPCSKVNQRIQEIKQAILEYEKKVGLGRMLAGNDVERFLHMAPSEMRKLSPDECLDANAVLLKEAAFLQSEINRQKAVASWCEEQIDGIIASKIHEYGSQFTPAVYKRKMAIRESEVAVTLERTRLQASLRVQVLEYIPNHLQQVARAFEAMHRTFQGRPIG